MLIEIRSQLWCHQFVSVNDEYPWAAGTLYGKGSSWFGTGMIAFGEGNNLTSCTFSNLYGMVIALHIADNYLIEVLNGVEYTLQKFLCIVGIDYY